MTEPPSDDYDSPWKEALERYLPDFLALLFPQAHAGIDWSQGYEFLDKQSVGWISAAHPPTPASAGAGGAVRSGSAFPASSCGTTAPAGRSWRPRPTPSRWSSRRTSRPRRRAGSPAERYRAKLALAKSLYRRGWGRDDILELLRFIDWMLRLPEDLEEQLWSEIQTYETVEHMPYVTSVERIGIRKGIQQGLQRERLLLLRLVDKRFGPEVAEQSAPQLDQIDNAQVLEDLAEALLDSTDGAAWLQALTKTAG